MSLTDTTCATDVVLNTDLYEITMAQGLWDAGRVETRACFNMFFRNNPFGGGYAVTCGGGQLADLIKNFSYEPSTIAYLASLTSPSGEPLFKPAFLEYLASFVPEVSIWAIPEGEVVFPREPMVRVEGPIIACQLIETALLNLVNFQTLVATKAARVTQIAEGRMVADFGLRRAQGFDGGLAVARASYVGGAASTSNCLAGKIYGIPVFGTHAHSWVMAFSSELEAFRAFARSFPTQCVLLIDTYDVRQGLANAITVAHEMQQVGEKLAAVRIDSGDLAYLSKLARKMLDAEGLDYVKIAVSNELDEYTIQSLLAQDAPIDSFGVGTKLATCAPEPSLNGVYKLTAVKDRGDRAWRPVIKLSESTVKRTIPGVLHVRRFYTADGCPVGDMIVDDAYAHTNGSVIVDPLDPVITTDFAQCESQELLELVVDAGCPTEASKGDIERARTRCKESLARFSPAIKRFLNPQTYPVGMERGLAYMRDELTRDKLAYR